MDVTLVTYDRFGRIARGPCRKGRPIPTNGIWIAAYAMESSSELLSFDQHFEEVDGIAWVQPW
jgi:tRNA(fMet)-specific endonuclease VapC